MMRLKSTYLCVAFALALAFGSATARCDVPASQLADGIAAEAAAAALAVATTAREEHGLPGLSVSVQRRGQGILWSAGLGEAWVETGSCMGRASVLPLGSVSKLVTAAVAARLVDRGVLAIDADIRELLPAAAQLPAPLTVRQLLGHLGGIRHYARSDFDPSQPGGIIDLRLYPDTASALAIFLNDPPVATPGERYQYSTFAYTLIAATLEAVAGSPFLDLIAAEVAEPLGVASLRGEAFRTIIPGRVGRYERDDEGTLLKAWPANVAYKWAGGGLVSTADDLARFGLAHTEPGYLKEATLTQMMTSQRTIDGEETNVGWGWRIGDDSSGRPVWHHAGAIGGGRAVLVVWPDEDLAVAMMTNLSATPGNIRDLAQEIGAAFLAD